jgi:phage shock protein E
MRMFFSTILAMAMAMAMALFLSYPVSANQAIQFQTFDNDVQVIDVRSDAEWNDGHHPAAQHLPHTKILEGNGYADLDKTKPVVLYCRSGGRAEQARIYLEAQGFTDVKNLGGISDLIIPNKDNQ